MERAWDLLAKKLAYSLKSSVMVFFVVMVVLLDFIQSYTLTTAQMVWTSIRSYPGIYKGYETYLHHLVLLLSHPDRLIAEAVIVLNHS